MARIEGQRNPLADYMSNFSRENQTRDSNKSKLTLADLQAMRSKTSKTFIKSTAEDDY